MFKVFVAGSGTDVGKTVASAILTTLLGGDYWKPIQCGEEMEGDTAIMQRLIDKEKHTVHPAAYSFKAALSPHHAARLENRTIQFDNIIIPKTEKPLVIEGVGGVFVPLTVDVLSLDLFSLWNCRCVVVSKHYLGSINHTLLTLDGLKRFGMDVVGIIFNGEPNPDSEEAICEISKVPMIGRLFPEPKICPETIQKYVKQWQPILPNLMR